MRQMSIIKRNFRTAITVSISSVAAILAVAVSGTYQREFNPRRENPIWTATPRDAYMVLKDAGGRGRTVLCLTLHSHSTAIDESKIMPYQPYSVRPIDLLAEFANSVDGNNLFWVLMQKGVVRKVLYAIPMSEWGTISKKVTGRETPPPLDLSYRGSPILLYTFDKLPEIREPVILFIDGSIYSALEPSQIAEYLKGKGIRYDMALLSPGFGEREGYPREKMEETARLLGRFDEGNR